MITTTLSRKENNWTVVQEPQGSTFIPSELLLTLLLENGWRVVKVEFVPSEDQLGLLHQVTLESDSQYQRQQILLPRTALIEEILDEQSRSFFSIGEEKKVDGIMVAAD